MRSCDFRKDARGGLQDKWAAAMGVYGLSLLATTVVMFVGAMIVVILAVISGVKIMANNVYRMNNFDTLIDFAKSLFWIGIVSVILGMITYFVTALFDVGLKKMFIDIIINPKKKIELGDLFSGCKYAFKAFGVYLLVAIYTALWSLLFIIPGVIKSYSYMLAPYIFANDPTKSVGQCIRESKKMMKGNKWRLFCLTFSFFGWALLIGVVTLAPVLGVTLYIPGILSLYVYMYTAIARFYIHVSGQDSRIKTGVSIVDDSMNDDKYNDDDDKYNDDDDKYNDDYRYEQDKLM